MNVQRQSGNHYLPKNRSSALYLQYFAPQDHIIAYEDVI